MNTGQDAHADRERADRPEAVREHAVVEVRADLPGVGVVRQDDAEHDGDPDSEHRRHRCARASVQEPISSRPRGLVAAAMAAATNAAATEHRQLRPDGRRDRERGNCGSDGDQRRGASARATSQSVSVDQK